MIAKSFNSFKYLFISFYWKHFLSIPYFYFYIKTNNIISFIEKLKFIIIYVISLIAGGLLSLYFHKDEYHYSAVGASGAVTGILYAAILLNPDMSLYFFFIPVPIPGYVFGIGYLLYSIYGMKKRIGNIGHDAHFGGAIGGYVTTLILVPYLFKINLTMVVVLALPIILLFVMKKLGKI